MSETEPPTMLCLPHAGAGAAVYRPWAAALEGVVRVVGVEPPGRGARRREPLAVTLPDLVAAIRPQVDEALQDGAPYLLYGHSLGSLVACALARDLRDEGREPAALVVSGRNGPNRVSVGPQMHRRSDAELLTLLHELGGTPAQIAEDESLMRLFLAPLRADLQAAETADRPATDRPLACPIEVLQGEDDHVVSRDGADAWRAETTGAFGLSWHPGGHFFTHEPGFVRATLRTLLAGPAAAATPTGTGSVR